MQSKSSTSLAIISILAIIIVFFIGVSNVEDAPTRKPFPTQGAELKETSSEEILKLDSNAATVSKTDEAKPLTQQPALQMSSSDKIEFQPPQLPAVEIQRNETTPPNKVDKIELLVKNINSEALTLAGFTSFVIKPQPFTGKLFDQFDLSMLSYLTIVDKTITENHNGNDATVLRAYEFGLSDKDQNQEVYDFLKAKIKDELGVTINETNQFGMSSFYINFNQPKEDAFLVVKTRTNVYALSYPKVKDGEKSYFNLVSKLFSELI